MFYGVWAGGQPTASAVMGDVVSAARNKVTGGRGPGESTYTNLPVLPVGEALTRYYVNLDVADRPGVLASIASAFSDNGVSVRSCGRTGTETTPGSSCARIVQATRHCGRRSSS